MAKDIPITIDGEDAARSNAAGTFVMRPPSSRGPPLVAHETCDSRTGVGNHGNVGDCGQVRHQHHSYAGGTGPARSHPAELKQRCWTTGDWHSHARVHHGQAAPVTTGPDGVAIFMVQTPEDEGLKQGP